MSEAGSKVDVTVGPITADDLREMMTGSAHSGPATPEEAWGLTTQPLGTSPLTQRSPAELELEAQQALARATSPELFPPPPNGGGQPDAATAQWGELDKFKQLYGQSENEKGALRQAMQEQMEAFNALMAQYQTLQAQAPQPNAYGPPQAPAYGPPQYGYGYQAPFDPFEGLGDDDVVQGKQVKQLIERTIAPALTASFQQAQAASNRAQDLERRLVEQSKVAAGITAVDEFRMQQTNPWLANLPLANKVEAMKALKKQEEATKAWRAPQSAPTAPSALPQAPGSRVVSALSHVETTQPQAADLTQDALKAAFDRDYAIAMSKTLETGERAIALRQLGKKYNLPIGQGAMNVVSR